MSNVKSAALSEVEGSHMFLRFIRFIRFIRFVKYSPSTFNL